MIKKYLIFTISLILTLNFGYAQTELSYIGDSISIQKFQLNEALIVETDCDYYLSGESITLSIATSDYILETPLDISKVVYIEFFTHENRIITQSKIKMENGIGEGKILIPKNLPSGIYYYRAYTNYMRNFDIHTFYQNSITILNPFLSDLENVETKSALVDCIIYPEGGNFVANKTNKATCIFQEYYSSPILIKIIDSNESIITSFKTNEYGIGQFEFTPNLNEHYKLIAINKNHEQFEKNIKIQDATITLCYKGNYNDSIIFHLKKSNFSDFPLSLKAFYKNAVINIGSVNKNDSILKISKKTLPKGLVHFSLETKNAVVVSQRSIINNMLLTNKVDFTLAKKAYYTRDTVRVIINNTDPSEKLWYSISVYCNDSMNTQKKINAIKIQEFKNELYPFISNLSVPLNENINDSSSLNNILRCISKNNLENSLSKMQYESLEYLPEIDSDIIGGKVIQNETNNSSIIIQSFIDSSIFIQTTITDSNGQFFFKIPERTDSELVITNKNDTLNKLIYQDEFCKEFYSIKKENLRILLEFKNEIKQRMINLQIDDVYSSNAACYHQSDSAFDIITFDKTLFIDDYPTFTTFEEFIFEVFPWVTINKRKFNKTINISYKGTDQVIGENPLFLIDGIPTCDPALLISLKTSNIYAASVAYRKIFYQNDSFDGIISVVTKKGNGNVFNLPSNIIIVKYLGTKYKSNSKAVTHANKQTLPMFKSNIYNCSFKVLNPTVANSDVFIAPDYKGNFLIKCCIVSANGQKKYYYTTFNVN